MNATSISRGRQAISLEDVRNAILHLQSIGCKPTYTAIRAHIGRGSNSCIAKFIKEAKANIDQPQAIQDRLTEILGPSIEIMDPARSSRGRQSISFEDVRNAVLHLRGNGINPTYASIRAHIGRGSNTYIRKFYREAISSIDKPPAPKDNLSEGSDLTNKFMHKLKSLVTRMHEDVKQMADDTLRTKSEQLDAREEYIESRWERLKFEHQLNVKELERERKLTASLTAKIKNLEIVQERLQDKLNKKFGEHLLARSQASQEEERARGLETELRRVRENRDMVEHELAVRVQSERERIWNQVKDIQVSAIEAQDRLTSECGRLEREIREAIICLEQAQCGRLDLKIRDAIIRLEQALGIIHELQRVPPTQTHANFEDSSG